MKIKSYLVGIFLTIGSISLTAQTTHYINWEMSVGANATITIEVDDIIEWIHTDPGMPHDVTSTDPNAPIGFGSVLMEFGNTYSFTFNFPVVFDYECSLHPGSMFGTITVLASATCDPPTNLTLDNVTTTTANFSWTASLSEMEGYNWVVMNPGDNPETDPPVTNGSVATGVTTTEATGLMPGTIYHFFVSTLCDGSEESTFAGPLMFTTEIIPPACDPPTILILDNVTTTTANFSWTASPSEMEGYNWVVMNPGDNPETDPPVTNGSVATGVTTTEATGLMPGTTYHFFVSTLCGGGEESAFTDSLLFSTEMEAVTCVPPTNPQVENVTYDTATFSWLASDDETEGYSWVVMNIDDDPETDTPVTSGIVATGVTMAEAADLNPGTLYHFYVATRCDSDLQSDFEGPLLFSTIIIGIGENSSDDFQLYPNPTTGIVHFTAENNIESISVFNLLSQLVVQYQNKSGSATVEIDLSGLENGTYVAVVHSSNYTKNIKLIKY